MNDDIAMFESNQLRKSLEKQTLHAVELMKRNSILELKLAASSQREAPLQSASSQNKIIYDVDIEQLCIHYQRTKSLDDFEDAKEAELMAIREKFARFTSMPQCARGAFCRQVHLQIQQVRVAVRGITW